MKILGDVFAELAQMATAGTHGAYGMDDALTRQVRRQRTARWLLGRFDYRLGDGCGCLRLSNRRHEIGELQLHLVDQLGTALGLRAERIVPQFRDGELEVRNLTVEVERAGFCLRGALFSLLGPLLRVLRALIERVERALTPPAPAHSPVFSVE